MQEQKINNLISLQEAEKYCDYSHDYLRLRARTGKLKAVKQGKSWMTTREWLETYISKAETYKKK